MYKNTTVGIDLGTSNSAIAICYEDCTSKERTLEKIRQKKTGLPSNDLVVKILPIIQAVSYNTTAERDLLPAAIYLVSENDNYVYQLPWPESCEKVIVGQYARELGLSVPDQLCVSIKSWLCNAQIDRMSKILPWDASKNQADNKAKEKFSPFVLSKIILDHIKNALNKNFADIGLDSLTIGNHPIVLTVPASFDEIARSLTYDAAKQVGFTNITLLEEPQAAFYAWLDYATKNEPSDGWHKFISSGDIVLVCDLGGGTADFSLISIGEDDGNLALERISVGEHILLGGDNIDLALAFSLRSDLEASGKQINHWQFASLVSNARIAKELLFSDDSPDEMSISITGKSSSLFASTLSSKLTKKRVLDLVLDGFFPFSNFDEMPASRSSLGLSEFGLNYAVDPAITKYLACFLKQSAVNVSSNSRLKSLYSSKLELTSGSALFPNKILFNGGVFKANLIRNRLLEVVRSWLNYFTNGKDTAHDLIELPGGDYDLAVAKGAAYYAYIKNNNKGLRIRAGLARSYYIAIESSMLAVPGFKPSIKGLCVVAQGTEEGSSFELEGREFGLITGRLVEFRFFSSSVRAGDLIGTIVNDAETSLTEAGILSVTLSPVDNHPNGVPIPVRMCAIVNEVGILELWLRHTKSEEKWKLEFNIRTMV